MQPQPVPHATVKYRVALWNLAIEDFREIICTRPWKTCAVSAMVFLVAAAAAGLIQGFDIIEPYVVPILVGLGAVAGCFVGLFFARLLYFTPKKMCQFKQLEVDRQQEQFAEQLEALRIKFKSDILAEKAATRKATDECDSLRRVRGDGPRSSRGSS